MGGDIKSYWYRLVFFMNEEWRNKICKLGKIDARSLILKLARYRSKNQNENKTKIWIKKDDF